MRYAITFLAVLLTAAGARAADPVYLDELIETPMPALESQFGAMKREGCFQIAPDRFLLLEFDKKVHKPWRVVVSSIDPCKRVAAGPQIEVRERNGVQLGEATVNVIGHLGRPDASAPPDSILKKIGETEYLYICRAEQGCSRHTSVLIRDGVVTGIAVWYSD